MTEFDKFLKNLIVLVSSYQFDIDNMDLLAHMSPSESQEIIKLRSSSCNDVPSPVNEKPTVTDVFNKPMFVSPNLEVKIADLGNACWAVSGFIPSLKTFFMHLYLKREIVRFFGIPCQKGTGIGRVSSSV